MLTMLRSVLDKICSGGDTQQPLVTAHFNMKLQKNSAQGILCINIVKTQEQWEA